MAWMLIALMVPGAAQATHGSCVLDVSPETDENALGQTHVLTATLRPSGTDVNASPPSTAVCADHGRVTINFEISGTSGATYNPGSIDAASTGANDLSCQINQNENSCTVDYTRTAVTGTDTIVGSVGDASTVTDTVTKTWTAATTPGSGTLLNVLEETDSNPLRTTHTLTAEVRNASGTLVSGARVDFEVTSGPNVDLDNDSDDVDRTCTTGTNGRCTVSYTDAAATSGQIDTICAWLDTDNDENFSTSGDNSDGGDCDSESNTESEGSSSWGTDATDRVTKTWSGTTTTGAIYLNVVPEEEENEIRDEHEMTAVARNSNGGVVSGVEIDFEIIDGPNEDLDTEDADLQCTTGSDGTCEVSYDDESASVGEVDEICAWIDSDDDDDFDEDEARNDGGDCDAEDDNETEDSARTGTDAFGNDDTDVVQKEWIASSDAFYLNVSPENARNEPGTSHTITGLAHDRDGNLAVGVSIDFEIVSGPNADLDNDSSSPDFECITDDNGVCSVTYTDGSDNPAANTDTICGWLDIEDDDDYHDDGDVSDGGACDEETLSEPEDSSLPGSDTFGNDATDAVAKSWGAGQAPVPCQVEGAIVGTTGADTLIGTTGDDVICGLGGADTILGYGGNDLILGGGGADNIRGGAGDDRVRAGGGDDYVAGQGGNDRLRGGDGNDYLLGGSGSDRLRGGDGTDVLDGGRNVDLCGGGGGNDRLLKCEG